MAEENEMTDSLLSPASSTVSDYKIPDAPIRRRVSSKQIPVKEDSNSFHAAFPEHKNEPLVEEFFCAIPMKILIQAFPLF